MHQMCCARSLAELCESPRSSDYIFTTNRRVGGRCVSGPLGPYAFRLVVTPCLVWANAIVHAFPKIAVHAKDLVTGRKSLTPEIPVCRPARCSSLSCNLYAVRCAVIIDVIERKKLTFRFTATSTALAAIRFKNRLSHPLSKSDGPDVLHLPIVCSVGTPRGVDARLITRLAFTVGFAVGA